MNKYEIMYILRPELDDAARKTAMETINGVLDEVTDVNEWGQRELAYEINDFKKGYYVVLKTNSTADSIKEFDRLIKINANVIRHMIIREEA